MLTLCQMLYDLTITGVGVNNHYPISFLLQISEVAIIIAMLLMTECKIRKIKQFVKIHLTIGIKTEIQIQNYLTPNLILFPLIVK